MLYGMLSPASILPKSLGLFSFIPYFDKIVHAGMFAGFSFLLFLLIIDKKNILRSIFITLFISISFGFVTELLQLVLSNITHRSFELMDFLADSLGVVLSMFLCSLIIIKQGCYKE